MAEIQDSKTRQQDQQAYQEYKDRLQKQIQDKEVLKALEELKNERSGYPVQQQSTGEIPTDKAKADDPSAYDDAAEVKMRKFQHKVAPYQTWGSMVGMPLIAKDSFAPMLGGTRFANTSREYAFNRRVTRLQSSARTDEREAMMLAARLDPSKHKDTPTHELERLAKDSYFARRYAPTTADEATRFANIKLNKAAESSGDLRSEQHKFLGLRKPEEGPSLTDSMKYESAKALQEAKIKGSAALGIDAPNINPLIKPSAPTNYNQEQLSQMVSNKAISDFTERQSGVRAGMGKILYGSSDERQNVLRNMPIDLSDATAAGRVVGNVGAAANIGLTSLPALSVGLGGAANFQKLANLRRDRHITGTAGKVAEGATTASQLTRSALFAPAASVMALRGMTGTEGLIGGATDAAYKGLKDTSFGLTSGLGGGVLKMASGAANMIPGVDGVNLGTSLAGAAKGVGIGASMASMAPALVGGLTMALPGIIGSIASAKADKKRRILRGFKQPTDKLVKQFSRSRGIDSVIRNLFSAKDITSDRMLELQLLMYIEQNTSSIPKMVSDIGLMSDRQEKDSSETINQIQLQQEQADAKAPGLFGRIGRRIGYTASQTLTGAQELAHTLNIPGQIFDLLINQKTPWARKEEFRQQREESLFAFKGPEHQRTIAKALGTTSSHVQLLGTPGARLIRGVGAESADAQQLAVQIGIFDLLRYEFGAASRKHLADRGMSLEMKSPYEEIEGFKKFLHMIPGISSAVSAFDMIKGTVTGTVEKAKSVIPKLTFGKEQRELLARADETKQDLGYTKRTDQKIEMFKLKLPDLWSRLIYLNEVAVNALHNIFNVGNKLLSTTGQAIEFKGSDSEQKVFDYQSGDYVTAKEYNKKAIERRKAYSEATQDKPSAITRIARKLFGGEEKVKAARTEHLKDQWQSEEFATTRRQSISSQISNVDSFQQADDYRQQRVSNGEFSVSSDSCLPICPKSLGVIRNDIPKFEDTDKSAKIFQFKRADTTRSASDELDENEKRDETKKREDTRKDLKDKLKKILGKLDKVVGNTKSFGEGVIEKGKGFFGKLGGLLMAGIGPLIAMATPLIASIGALVAPLTTVAAGIAGLLGISMFRRHGEGIGAKESMVDTAQDLGMVRNVGKNVAGKATSIGKSMYSTGGQAYKGAATFGNIAKESATAKGGMFAKFADKIGTVATKGGAFAGDVTSRLGAAVSKAPGAISSVAGRAMDTLKGGGTIAKGVGAVGSGIGKIAGFAGKYSPHMMVADSALRFAGDMRDGSRFEKRSDAFKKEMAESGMFGKAWAIAKKVINPYEGGALAGTAINKGINKAMQFMTGEKGATLGGKIYDWTHPGQAKKAREAEEKIKQFREAKKAREEKAKQTVIAPPKVDVKTEKLESKTEEQTSVIRSGLDRLASSSEGLLNFFKEKLPGDKPSPAEKDDGVWSSRALSFINDHSRKIETDRRNERRGEVSPDRLNMKQIKDNVVKLRLDEQLPTVKELHRQEAKIEVPQHSSVPQPMAPQTQVAKTQSTQDRPVNPQLTGFIDNLFNNTITSLQHGIKTYAQGQTPFQIIR